MHKKISFTSVNPKKLKIIFLVLSIFLLPTTLYAAEDLKSIMQLIEKGEKEKASQQIDQYLKINPNDPQVIFIKGVMNAELGKYQEAIEAFTYLTEKNPNLPEPFNNLAVLFAELGDYEKAQKALESAIKTHPSYATAHINLGDLYTKRASLAYNKALEIDKGNPQAKTKLSLIKKLFNANDLKIPNTPLSSPAQISLSNDINKKTATNQPTMVNSTPNLIADSEPSEKDFSKETRISSKNNKHASESEFEIFLTEWAEAWSSKNIAAYLSKYSPNFQTPNGESLADWQEARKSKILGKNIITVSISKAKILKKDDQSVEVNFRQKYNSNKLTLVSNKTLVLKKTGSAWLIEQEYSGKL